MTYMNIEGRSTHRLSFNLDEKLFSFKRYLDYFGPWNCINSYTILEDNKTIGGHSDL